jgi:acetoin utilization deacetylase AcuC-like enzyme
LPVLRQFEPDLIIVSAGFDAHERDPLGGMRLSTDAFAAMTLDLRAVAEDCCRGRIVSVTEGGLRSSRPWRRRWTGSSRRMPRRRRRRDRGPRLV